MGEVANFRCELASDHLAIPLQREALSNYWRALDMNRKSVRASMLLGDLHAAEGDDQEALEAWKKVESQNPVYLAPLVAERLMDAYRWVVSSKACNCAAIWRSTVDLLDALFQWGCRRRESAAYHLV